MGRAEAITAAAPGFDALLERAGFEAPAVRESRRAIVRVELPDAAVR